MVPHCKGRTGKKSKKGGLKSAYTVWKQENAGTGKKERYLEEKKEIEKHHDGLARRWSQFSSTRNGARGERDLGENGKYQKTPGAERGNV